MSAWVKVNSGSLKVTGNYRYFLKAEDPNAKVGDINGNNCVLPIKLYNSDLDKNASQRDFGITPEPVLPTDGWQYVEIKIPAKTDISAGDWDNYNWYSRVFVGNGETNVEAYVDDIRIYPEDALVTSSYYNLLCQNPTLTIDPNNNPGQKVAYDYLGRSIQWFKFDNNGNDILLKTKDFHYKTRILVYNPNENDSLYANDIIKLQWLNFPGATVNVSISINGGLNWVPLGGPLLTMPNGLGEFQWNTPPSILNDQRICDNCYIKVENTQPGQAEDVGISRKFTISMGDIIVVDPVGGSDALYYLTISDIKIQWEAFGQIADVGIYYSIDNKITWHEIISSVPNLTTPNKGKINSYTWNVPDDFPVRTDCWIRVNSLNFFEYINDICDKPIRFLKHKPFIKKENMGL
jgi:hypothetical protein